MWTDPGGLVKLLLVGHSVVSGCGVFRRCRERRGEAALNLRLGVGEVLEKEREACRVADWRPTPTRRPATWLDAAFHSKLNVGNIHQKTLRKIPCRRFRNHTLVTDPRETAAISAYHLCLDVKYGRKQSEERGCRMSFRQHG